MANKDENGATTAQETTNSTPLYMQELGEEIDVNKVGNKAIDDWKSKKANEMYDVVTNQPLPEMPEGYDPQSPFNPLLYAITSAYGDDYAIGDWRSIAEQARLEGTPFEFVDSPQKGDIVYWGPNGIGLYDPSTRDAIYQKMHNDFYEIGSDGKLVRLKREHPDKPRSNPRYIRFIGSPDEHEKIRQDSAKEVEARNEEIRKRNAEIQKAKDARKADVVVPLENSVSPVFSEPLQTAPLRKVEVQQSSSADNALTDRQKEALAKKEAIKKETVDWLSKIHRV